MKNSTNAKCQEDWMYLESIRGSKRLGTLGKIDSHDLKRIKRKRVREEKMRKERSVSNTKYLASEFTQSISSSEEIDIDDTEFKIKTPRKRRPKKRKKMEQVVSPPVISISEKIWYFNQGNV